jgi:hypothetical protein
MISEQEGVQVFVPYCLGETNGHRQALTLFALAHPIDRERRGGVIVDGGHGKGTIDIILCPNRPRFRMFRVQITSQFSASWANSRTIAEG